jgi:hypothetical protein
MADDDRSVSRPKPPKPQEDVTADGGILFFRDSTLVLLINIAFQGLLFLGYGNYTRILI